jgi:hypothetical protein
MIRRSIRIRGFTLTEMIGALFLLTVFGFISARLFTETIGVLRRAPAATDAVTRFESVSETLRQDAWGGRSFSTAGPNSILIDRASQPSIRWEIDLAGDVYRTQGIEHRRWLGAGTSAVFEIEGPCIVLHSTSRAPDSGPEVRFVSLIQLAAARGGNK